LFDRKYLLCNCIITKQLNSVSTAQTQFFSDNSPVHKILTLQYSKGDFMKTVIKSFTLMIFTFGFLTLAASSAKAVTFTVNTTNDTVDATAGNGICADSIGNCSLRAAITESNALAGADIISLPAGTYTETLVSASDNVNAGGDFDITSDIQIIGAGSAGTIVQANVAPGVATERVFHIRGALATTTLNVLIEGVTIQNGRYAVNTFGAGVRVDQGTNHNVTFGSVVFNANQDAGLGGGLSISTAITPTVTITNCTFSNNTSGSSVAATTSGGSAIHVNTASTVNITGTTITGNTATTTVANSFGAGIGITTSGLVTMTIAGSTIRNNINTSVTGAFVAYGGGIFFRDGNLTITNSTISGNSATGVGGGMASWFSTVNPRTISLTNVNVTGNSVTNNVNENGAAGIEVDNFGTGVATANITDSTIASNTGAVGSIGGGIYNWSEAGNALVNITNSTIRDNRADNGGGIVNEADSTGNATVTLINSAVTGNIIPPTVGDGGGILNLGVSTTGGLTTVNATNTTISGNSGTNGGGIANEGAGSPVGINVNLNYVTVVLNSATTNAGGGLLQLSGAINIKNTIVANNTSFGLGPDIFGTITSQDYNHVEDITGGVLTFASVGRKGKNEPVFFVMPNDVTGTDPMLGSLANNGGATQTHLPMWTSPVMNAIPNLISDCGGAVTTSQNAVTRPQQTGCEKGAAERPAPTAASASIRGRVLTTTGRGLLNAFVVLTNTNTGEIRRVRTTSLGYFNIQDLQTGDFYILGVQSKRYTFENQSFTLNDNIDDLVLTAQ
jgi:CSLREA domain-containing protein